MVVLDLDVDYLVVGAGATGLAFVDALVDHRDDVRVALVDRRHGVGGHWLEAYPFVRLHQASSFYGVASTVLGGGRLQDRGPEAGRSERAGQAQICDYYARVADRLIATGRVEILGGCDYTSRDRMIASRVSGRRYRVPTACRIVDARYLAPDIPARLPPRFEVGAGARVVPVNELVLVDEARDRYVVVGSGKTATDAVVWLLGRGVDPDAICWVRPREPWMLDRAVVQPDPVVFAGMVADTMAAAAGAASLDDLFARLEGAGVMMRIDPSVTPTMAKAPTLGRWELDLLRSVEDVVRLGHVTAVTRGRIELSDGSVDVPDGALVVNCAADGLRNRPTLPVWGPEAITLQMVRAGFPCFGAALIGYVEATRGTDPGSDTTKNGICPPSAYGNTLAQWARMTLVGAHNAATFNAEPDVADWAHRCALNPARVPPERAGDAGLDEVRERIARSAPAALSRLSELAV